ncbi:MAG TPA: aspartate aminotransferase family protein [Candidatus Deferrimicrobiaceae bacterium]|jgi:predicted acetylornithine/succinylornithine family transaminase
MSNASIVELTARYQMSNYSRFPIAIMRGDGVRLFDADGREYLDFLGGIAVTVLGHANPEVARAISTQAASLVHVSNLFHVPAQSEAAALLSRATTGGKVFFCNSGSEANEAAIKLSRKWSVDRGRTDAFEIVAIDGSFHGRTYGSLSATGQPKFHEGFTPMLPGFRVVPFGDLAALEAALTDKTCALMVEPMQGEIGVRMHPAGWYEAAARLCRERGILLIADEIQTGIGRTGDFLASKHFGVTPDIVTLAKGIANGLPLGAVVARDEVAASFGPGSHGSTFGGNPVCCSAAKVVLETVCAPEFLDEVRRKGVRLSDGLRSLASRRTDIVEVRGMGLMIAAVMTGEAKPISNRCLENGFIVNATGNVLRFLPALTVTDAEIDRALVLLEQSLPGEGRR